mgnify:CR=1 FL=1
MSGYGQALSFANKNKGKAASGAKAGGKFAVAHKEEVKIHKYICLLSV